MGTVADKLTYLNTTKTNLKDSINNLGGDIDNNTTFRNYATELDNIYNKLPKVSDTGTSISLTPTLKGRLGIVPKGNTLQDGTPTPDTPVEIQNATGTQNIVVSDNNNNSQEVEIDLGNIELCKIGNYQDKIYKNNGKWYLHKEIKKAVLNGSETWNYTSGTRERFTTSISDIELQPFNSSAPLVVISDYFSGTTWYNLYNNTSLDEVLSSHDSAHQLNIRSKQFLGDTNDFKTWLSNNNVTIYYVLSAPTNTEITDTTLLNQLEQIYNLKSYDDTTNIDITGNLPMIITASALKGE